MRHKHKCYICHCVWEHGEECANDVDAHKCPRCQTIQSIIHVGDEAPVKHPVFCLPPDSD